MSRKRIIVLACAILLAAEMYAYLFYAWRAIPTNGAAAAERATIIGWTLVATLMALLVAIAHSIVAHFRSRR